MGPRYLLPALVVVLAVVCAGLVVPAPIMAAAAGGAVGGATAALVTVWRVLPRHFRPFVTEAVRAKVRG